MVQEANWDPTVLQHTEVRMSDEELRRFSTMGAITPDEVIEFHYALDHLVGDGDPSDEPR